MPLPVEQSEAATKGLGEIPEAFALIRSLRAFVIGLLAPLADWTMFELAVVRMEAGIEAIAYSP